MTFIWSLVCVIAWTSAVVIAAHWWASMRAADADYRCHWGPCTSEATNRVQIRHPAGDVQLPVCDQHTGWARGGDDVFDWEVDQLERQANGEKP